MCSVQLHVREAIGVTEAAIVVEDKPVGAATVEGAAAELPIVCGVIAFHEV